MMRRTPCQWLMPRMLTLLAAAAVCLSGARGEEIRLPLTAAARIIAPARVDEPQPMQMQPQQQMRAEPTLPDARLPQYELSYTQRQTLTDAQRQSGTLCFELALPEKPLLIEATIRIDGKPFTHARDRRVTELLAAVTSGEADSLRGFTDEAQKVRRYVAATGEPPGQDEVRSLLTHWLHGPELLLLNRNFQKFRANERPLFRVFDRNGDGVIDRAESEQASDSLSGCDFNGDGIIDVQEIIRAARALPPSAVSDPTDATQRVLKFLRETRAPPDLSLEIAFDSNQPEQSRLSLVAISGSLDIDINAVSSSGQEITLRIANLPISFSMVQSNGAERTSSADQVSVGGVIDGYPLIPDLDPNNDGRFTVRELRSLASGLKRFDANQDGTVTLDETAPTTRICFGLGPIVHRELANLRQVPVDTSTPADAIEGPDWFTRMDRNHDNDLTRAEFLGTDEQFATLDRDGDGLISATEAIQFEQGATPQSQD